MGIATTKRDESIVETLALKVRLASLEQIAANWWQVSPRAIQTTRERLKKLEEAGLVERRRVNIHPLLNLSTPVVTWSLNEAEPNFGQVGYRLRSRWQKAMQLTTIYLATRMAANQCGGFGGKFKHRTQLTHDVHVAGIYFELLKTEPNVRQRWSGEELLEIEPGEKCPDAMLLDANGEPEEIIEFGGKYGPRRVAEFHRFCELREIGYRLW